MTLYGPTMLQRLKVSIQASFESRRVSSAQRTGRSHTSLSLAGEHISFRNSRARIDATFISASDDAPAPFLAANQFVHCDSASRTAKSNSGLFRVERSDEIRLAKWSSATSRWRLHLSSAYFASCQRHFGHQPFSEDLSTFVGRAKPHCTRRL